MKNVIHGLWMSAALAFALTVGCGEVPNNNTTCTSDSSCGATDMCHPVLKKCVPSCTGGVDCPSSAKTCATIDGSTDAGLKSFCQCSTDQLCNGSSAGDLVCQTETSKTCENKCGSGFSCPSGSTCDSASGLCKKGATDAGTDAGVQDAGVSCAGNDWDSCPSGAKCNFFTGFCGAPEACTAANPQPAECLFPSWCNAGTCAQVHKPTCANFTPPNGKTPVFDPLTNAQPAPIIYSIDNDPSPQGFVCRRGFFVHSMYLNVYRDDADWPAQLTAMPGIFYVRTDGQTSDLTAGLPTSYYAPNARQLRLRVYVCAQTQASLSTAFYYTNGNEICHATSGAIAGTTACTNNNQCGVLTCNTGTGTCE